MALKLSDDIAQRGRALDFSSFGALLPNPDPILKSQGKDITTYRDMRTDALVGSCIRRRKSAVKALDWGLDRGQAASRVSKAVEDMLSRLDLERIIGQMLDATLYGYQPMEITWSKIGALIVPVDVQAKPPEWFCFDPEANLRFKTRQDPLYGELLPAKKFLLPRQDATYQNPYGFADLSMCFWPLMFKKGGMKFWLAFAEKFGSGYLFGKLPRSATDEERATLLDSLANMIQDGVATIPDDGSIEVVEMAGKSASADLYERLVLHSRGEISIALLGQNQTTEASANKASSTSGLEVTKDLRDGDAKIIEAALNQLIEWVCDMNWGSSTAAPVWSMWDQKEQDTLQAARDKSNFEAGARFTNAYWERGYGYQAGDLLEAPTAPVAPATPAVVPAQAATQPAFAEGVPSGNGADPLQADTAALAQAGAPLWSDLVKQIQTLVDTAPDLTTLQQTLTQAYGGLDSAELVKLMAAALALAELKGLDAARSEIDPPAPAFAEASSPAPEPAPPAIHIHLPVGMVQVAAPSVTVAPAVVQFSAPAPAPVQIDVHVPAQPAPEIEVTVQPAPVTVNNAFAAKAVQTVERDANDEIVSTTTTYTATN